MSIFSQNIIAIIWDFDKTLIPGYMETPLFKHFGVEEKKFWKEVAGLPDFYKRHGLDLVSKDTLYLNHILTYAREGIFKGLSNELLRSFGKELEFYSGLPEFFGKTKERIESRPDCKKNEIKVEHYILSTGLRQIILGSVIYPYASGIWGCEFVETVAPSNFLDESGNKKIISEGEREIKDIGYVLDNTTKTRAIFEINKGTNIMDGVDVNASVRSADRRVPIQNMIYVADGPSDIPVFSILNKEGGRTFAVYPRASEKEFAQVNDLQKQGRVQSFGEADYTEGSKTYMWIMNSLDEIARKIIEDRDSQVRDRIGTPPRHFSADG